MKMTIIILIMITIIINNNLNNHHSNNNYDINTDYINDNSTPPPHPRTGNG